MLGTRDSRVPVDEHAKGVVLPRPDVELIEVRKAKPVWRGDEVQKLTEALLECLLVALRFPVRLETRTNSAATGRTRPFFDS